MTHLSEEDLVLVYYGEMKAPPHLAECPQCRANAESLAHTLNLCNQWIVPEAPPELERSVWAQIAPQLTVAPRQFRWPVQLRWPVWVAAFAALVLVAFVLGRVTTKPAQPALMTGLSREARDRILQISLADHLDRAGMLLTEISNVSDLDVSERDRAQDLVEEGRLMRQVLLSRNDSGTLALMDDVERFMLEVANSSSSAAELQKRIASGSLLFKVRIIESNLRTQGIKL